jgi:hypothetical protein
MADDDDDDDDNDDDGEDDDGMDNRFDPAMLCVPAK